MFIVLFRKLQMNNKLDLLPCLEEFGTDTVGDYLAGVTYRIQ